MEQTPEPPPRLPTLDLDVDYRQLLREKPADDSSTDENDFVDEPSSMSVPGSDAPSEIDVVGVSISRAQTYMKSPVTPAVEKAKALENAPDYFGEESVSKPTSEDASESCTPALPPRPFNRPVTPPKPEPGPASLQTVVNQQPRRSSLLRSILGETDSTRRRSNSGPTMFSNLRKMLPTVGDLPTVPVLKVNASAGQRSEVIAETHKGHESNPERPFGHNQMQVEERGRSAPSPLSKPLPAASPSALDGNVEPLLSPTGTRPGKKGRSSSETSLYLHRRPTGASGFDDTNAFADVTEMNNARFKAITDSFQNSTIRMPKLPNVKYYAKRGSDPASNSVDDLTETNTRINQGGAPRQDSHLRTEVQNRHHYIPFIEVENSQQRAHPIISDALGKLTGDLVIMGGYRGSILRDAKTHRQLWAPVKVGLNLRHADLEVGLTREEEETAHQKIFPSGVLSHIGPIDICRRLLKHVRKCPNFRHDKLRLHDYGYDWRLSPDLLAERFIKYLEGLQCNQPGTPPEHRGATVIAHSLGGLITRWAVNKRPELFAGIVYAGAPQNAVNILGPIRNGDDVLLSSKVLTAQVNFTMRTSYALLPEDGRCFINKHTNERYDIDFFDPQTWDDYCLTPCINPPIAPIMRQPRKSIVDAISNSMSAALPSMPSLPSVTAKRGSWFGGNPDPPTDSSTEQVSKDMPPTDSPKIKPVESTLEPSMRSGSSISSKPSIATACTIPLPQAKEYLSRTLSEILGFKLALRHNESLQKHNRYPPHALIFGKSVPTVYGARVASRDHIKYTDAFDDLAFAAGDGVVLASAAQLPEGYRCVRGGRVETDRGHVGLLGDLEGVGRCLLAVVEGRGRGVGMGCYGEEKG